MPSSDVVARFTSLPVLSMWAPMFASDESKRFCACSALIVLPFSRSRDARRRPAASFWRYICAVAFSVDAFMSSWPLRAACSAPTLIPRDAATASSARCCACEAPVTCESIPWRSLYWSTCPLIAAELVSMPCVRVVTARV